ncbi:hypothetical protein C8R48DRAFT_771086 [Suillus tomentosus]|nr:hypothetical protein C8R48DRAFT_771086 [Suillus tomentosus]
MSYCDLVLIFYLFWLSEAKPVDASQAKSAIACISRHYITQEDRPAALLVTMAQPDNNFMSDNDPEINPNPQNLAAALMVIGWTARNHGRSPVCCVLL